MTCFLTSAIQMALIAAAVWIGYVTIKDLFGK